MEEAYLQSLSQLATPSFKNIQELAANQIKPLASEIRDRLWAELERGKALLNSHHHLCQYLYSFGNMHEAKLEDALAQVPSDFWQRDFEIIDWGCGQAIGSLKVFDLLRAKNLLSHVKRITLIEPGKVALERAENHIKAAKPGGSEINSFNSYFEELNPSDLASNSSRPRLHVFSNILDVEAIDLKKLADLLDRSTNEADCIVAVGPIYSNSHRVEAFMKYFQNEKIQTVYSTNVTGFKGKSWTYLARVWTLNTSFQEHIKKLRFYPSVHFTAAYAVDLAFNKETSLSLKAAGIQNFAVSAPFDLGAHVYSDLDPLFTVMHNIIVRGTPTKASPFIEKLLSDAFGFSEEVNVRGGIDFMWNSELVSPLNLKGFIKDVFQSPVHTSIKAAKEKEYKQFIFTPIAVARFHKILLEALLTGKLTIDLASWKIMVEEKDVPFAALAIEDFKQLFQHMSGLFDNAQKYKLPRIELSVLGQKEYLDSPLHLGQSIHTDKREFISGTYDLVIRQGVFEYEGENMDRFEDFQAKNEAYFHIYSTRNRNVSRYIYTTSLIKYQPLINTDARGNHTEISDAVEHLEYFLRLFFRKQEFRPGQLPILDRALRNLPVIGLLPTGGGKSLTYQIAALLQPGLTMVVDPLKSLMKDQYEGLLNAGIDAATYINSSLSSDERKYRERQLESSQVLFTFLSPERLGISTFRERLEKMYDRDAYFSYGVIDEVHCVSEWGHDFRFNYLHLGRNLYQYVKAREGHISLFGLTATASFDVLADVERELSANGAFELDADTIVRFENTNRLELQYKIERVAVSFEVDQYYDNGENMPAHLPKAINVRSSFAPFESKAEFLLNYISALPNYLIELEEEDSIGLIAERFFERQNLTGTIETDLEVRVDQQFWQTAEEYHQAGIVFCPHVNSTGVSVRVNSESLKRMGIKDLSSYSGKDDDTLADESLNKFRENKSPLMVATKAFGMGIDKPNVRYTVNMNYSSSLEAFVQEAGRAGRDQKMALSSILFSDYEIAQIRRDYPTNQFPIGVLRNKWFYKEDLKTILEAFDLYSNEEYLIVATPSKDVVKLHCKKNNKMFGFRECDNTCSEYRQCQLRKVSDDSRGWMEERELLQKIRAQKLSLGKKDFQYLSPDYQTNIFFYANSFKGDFVEKTYMHRLLSVLPVSFENETEEQKGILDYLLSMEENTQTYAYISYIPDESIPKGKMFDTQINRQSDLSKAIYRLTCIGLIDDFTQDYASKEFKIGFKRRAHGEYYAGLQVFLERYFTQERAINQIEKVKAIELPNQVDEAVRKEIYQCLNFLTQFVYEKISEKRKRAIDDIRNFCLIGLENPNWLEANEELKDYIYYYFNSKYSRRDNIAPNGEAFSLVEDTQEGRFSDAWIVEKYLRIIDDTDPATAAETPLDNVKHLFGAIRLLARSLTDSNPSLYLLEAFCLAYLNPSDNENLIQQLEDRYTEGMTQFFERLEGGEEFWTLFDAYNKILVSVWSSDNLNVIIGNIELIIHLNRFKQIKTRYTA